MVQQANTGSDALYQIDGKPSFKLALPQALQHVLAMLVGNITPPILIAQTLQLSDFDRIELMQVAMIVGGLTTLIQLFPIFGFGMGLPCVMGTSFAYMPVLLSIGLAHGISAVFGAQLIGSIASIFIGMIIGKIRRFFPPIVCGTVVLSIGLSLYNTAISYMAGGGNAVTNENFGLPKYWIIAIIVLIITLGCSLFGKGTVKVSGMLISIAAGYIISLIAGDMISFDGVGTAGWFAFPKFLHFGISFVPSAIISMILMYIVQAVQTMGDVAAITTGAFDREATDEEFAGAIKGAGLVGIIGSLIGGLPTGPYGQNVGLIVTTKVVAKKVFAIVGGLMIFAGFFPKFGALITTIPYPVLGGATITIFAAITMSGIQLITQQPLNYRNKMIVGTSLALGVGISNVSGALAQMPQMVQDLFSSSPIILAFLVAFILNLVVPDEEK